MVLSNFIRRNHAKRKTNKAIAPRAHKSASPSLVLDINDESLPAQSHLVKLDLSASNEEWFPHELLHRSYSPSGSLRLAQNDTVLRRNRAQETRPKNTSPALSLGHSDSASSVSVQALAVSSTLDLSKPIASRKKSIPTPIMIPDHPMHNVQIGHPALPRKEPPTESSPPDAGDALSQPSPSVVDNLSSISGTTIARALIGSSFVLSSSEHRGSQHRSGVARQDSATLPRGSLFLSGSRSSSPIPPVPPVPANLASPDSTYPSTVKSGASTESEYPMSDSYITSPEAANSPLFPKRIPRIHGVTSPEIPVSTMVPPAPVVKLQWRGSPGPARARVFKNGVFDVPKAAVEPLSQDPPIHSSQEGSILLSSDDHSLDEFDFMPGPLVQVASPKSDSSSSYISPAVPLARHSETGRGQWKRRAAGLNVVRHDSRFSLADGTFATQQASGLPSPSASDLDYGELLNYDLTVSPGESPSSGASAGYQTFPETPVALSPLGSSTNPFFAKSDSQVLRRRISSMRSVGRGPGKLSYMRSVRRQMSSRNGGVAMLRRSHSSLLPRQEVPSPKQLESNLPPSLVEDDAGIPEDDTNPLTTSKEESQHTRHLSTAERPHPLDHISPSSSYVLEEEALRALAECLPSSLPSITIADVDPSFDPRPVPVPDTDDVSPFNSPALTGGSPALSPLTSPLQSSLPTSSTAISQFEPSKPLLSPPDPSPAGSLFLSSVSSSSLGDPLSPKNSPTAVPSFSARDELVSQSPSPSFASYPTVVSEKTMYQSTSVCAPSLSRTRSAEPAPLRSREASDSSPTSGSTRTRGRSRPIGPRKPSGPAPVAGSLFPGIFDQNGSTSSVGRSDPSGSSGFPWPKLYTAASKPPPKFHAPRPKWRGLTLEVAQWTLTSAQLQQIVSQAIQQSSEGSALRFLRPDVLEGEIADELQRLELQHVDVKAQYKALSRQRWILMGALTGYIEGVHPDATTAARALEELAEVLVALDGLADKMHNTVLQMAHLKSLRDVHNTSAVAMALRKINDLFVRQIAEKEQLQEQVDALRTERDEAWKNAEEIAQDYDTLNDRVSESGCGDGKSLNGDASSATGSRRSAQVSAKRKSSVRQSQAGLRSRSRGRHRAGQSSSNATRPSSLALDNIPPVPRIPVNPSMGSSGMTLASGMFYGSAYTAGTTPGMSAALALAEAQREVYEMLGLSLPPSQASSRRRTMSGSAASRPPSPKSRPASESLDVRTRVVRRVRSRQEWGRATWSVVLDDHFHVRPLATAHG